MSIWVNGRIRKSGERAIDLTDRGVLLGDGLFETLLVRDGVPVFLEAHLDRLRAAAEVLDMPVPFDDEAIDTAIRKLSAGHESDALSARITLTRGSGTRGVLPPRATAARPQMAIALGPAAPPRRKPVLCMVSSVRRNEGSPAASMKTLSYMDNILARQEAASVGADEAIMLNNQGYVTCASAANLFLVVDDEYLVTPNSDCGILPGIVRNKVIGLARASGIPVEFGFVQDEDLRTHPVFLTNSLIGLQPVRMMDAGEHAPGELFSTLRPAYNRLVAADARQRSRD